VKAEMALMTVVGRGRAPSRTAAAKQLGLKVSDIDRVFGVLPVDPEKDLYAVRVRADRINPKWAGSQFQGPFADPEIASIAPFGLGKES
jgi:hypothetical protein